MTARNADVISSGRDPDRLPRRPSHWWLAAAAVVLIGGGITASVQLAGRPTHHPPASRPPAVQVVRAMLHGEPAGPDVAPGTALLLAGNDLRLLSVTGRAPVSFGWAEALLGLTGRSTLGSTPAVLQLEPVSGGFVTLVANVSGSGVPAVGDVLFIPVTSHGVAAPHVIAHANYLAVAPNDRDIWVQQAGPGYLPGATWLIDQSGQRLSSVLRLRRQVLIADTTRGLLAGSVHGGVKLISTDDGATLSMRVPATALIAAVSADDVAWQSPSCGRRSFYFCPLHVTSLRSGTDTVIALPRNTETNGDPGSFDQADKRLALPLDTINREHLPAATYTYVVDIGIRRMTRLPGGPMPFDTAATSLGAIAAGAGSGSSVSWSDGPDLWIVATGPAGFQAAYWPGAGPLRVLSTQPGEIYLFAVDAGSAASG